MTVLFKQDNSSFIQHRDNGGCAGVLNKLHIGGDTIIKGDIFPDEAEYPPRMDGYAVIYFCSHSTLLLH